MVDSRSHAHPVPEGRGAVVVAADLIDSLAATAAERAEKQTESDAFGFDPWFADDVAGPLLSAFYDHWFRVDVTGIEHLPATGKALVVSNHAGALPWDTLMTSIVVRRAVQRHLRILAADLAFRFPGIAAVARGVGAVPASPDNAHTLLSEGNIVGVWPEGFKGLGKHYSQRYQLARFGRGGFVHTAVVAGAPIIPVSVVGSEEIYPQLGSWESVAELFDLPYFPVTPFFPHFGPLGIVPLPTKWSIEIHPPVSVTDLPEGTAEDPVTHFALTDQVRDTIAEGLRRQLRLRRDIFAG